LVIACDDTTTTSPVYDGPSYEVTDSSSRTGRNLLYIPDGDTIYIDKSSTYPPFDMKITILDEQKETKIIIEGSVGRNVGMAVYSMTVPPFYMTNDGNGTIHSNTFTTNVIGTHNIDS
jgi:DNA-binding beta-propeller fold protein YncE